VADGQLSVVSEKAVSEKQRSLRTVVSKKSGKCFFTAHSSIPFARQDSNTSESV
jgi:hypothetical protein